MHDKQFLESDITAREFLNNKIKEAVPRTIQIMLDQIGKKALYMMGTKQTTYDGENILKIRFTASRRVNYIKLEYLPGRDLYNITFYKIHGMNVKEIASYEHVYADMLHQLIQDEAKIYLSL